MANYCISDIHGNLKALQALLVLVNFQYDGTDKLYLLGDYVDWGPDSIETLRYVMRLSKHPFVTCLMGNHDLMFLDEICHSDCGRDNCLYDKNWLFNNRGFRTWEEYLELTLEEREEIRDWLLHLPYSAEVQIQDKWYLLGHASPYLLEDTSMLSVEEQKAKQYRSVWKRMSGPADNPLHLLEERFPYAIEQPIKPYGYFICGHSITYHYMSYKDNEPYRIFLESIL